MTTKALTKAPPKPAAIGKKRAAATEAIEQAYAIALSDEARERLVKVVEARDYILAETARAAGITVTSDETDQQAADATVNLTKARKLLEELQSYFTSPLEARKKQVIGWFKEQLKEPVAQETRLRAEGGRWFQKKENERLEADRKRLADQQEAQRKARQLGRTAPLPPPAPVVAETPKTTEAENGSRSYRMVPVARLVDITQVPEAYIIRSLNTKAVDAALAAGVREIPGLMIGEEAQAIVR